MRLTLRQLTHSPSFQTLPATTDLRPIKYLNNIVEQDHRFIKRLVNPGMGFGSFNTARRTLRGYEAIGVLTNFAFQTAKPLFRQAFLIYKLV